MTIEFREHHTLRHPFQLQVLRSGTLVGHVRRNAVALELLSFPELLPRSAR